MLFLGYYLTYCNHFTHEHRLRCFQLSKGRLFLDVVLGASERAPPSGDIGKFNSQLILNQTEAYLIYKFFDILPKD